MNRMTKSWLAVATLVAAATAGEALSAEKTVAVVTTTADLAAIAKAVGGEAVTVTSIARGYQDPHYVEAKPSYMLKVRRADLLLYIGLQLEVGWLPLLVEGARNSNLVSTPVGTGITVLELPVGEISRAGGDIHPEGNPHYWLDPRNGLAMAKTISLSLSRAQPELSSQFAAQREAFDQQLRKKIIEWEEIMAPYQGEKVVAYHKQWEYMAKWLGLEIVGYIEDKPGVPPSPAHLARIIRQVRKQKVPCVIAATFVDPKVPRIVAGKAGSNLAVLPSSVAAVTEAGDYIQLFDLITERLARALGRKGES